MYRVLAMFMAAALVVLGLGASARAHEGHDHKVLGTVTMAAADHVMLKDREGKDVTVLVNKATRVKSTPAMKVEEIKAGTRIVITATMDKNKTMTAKTIEVGAAK
jgi:hypothetical protein